MESTAMFQTRFTSLKMLTRFVAAVTFGITPLLAVITLGSDFARTSNQLELALSLNLVNLIVTSPLITLLGRRMVNEQVLFIASLLLCLYLADDWVRTYGMHISIIGLMVVTHVVYLLRLRSTINGHRETSDAFRLQFKMDTTALVCLTAYFTFFNLIVHHFQAIEYLFVLLAVLSVLLWAYLLWTVERHEMGTTKNAVTSMWMMLFIAILAVAIGIPVLVIILLLLAGGLGVILVPLTKLMPHFKMQWGQLGQIHQNLLKVTPGKSRQATNYLFTAGDVHIVAVCFFAIVAIIIIWVLLHRRKSSQTSQSYTPAAGALLVSERIRMSKGANLSFLTTADPVRQRVQNWLRERSASRQSTKPWQTIRDLSNTDVSGETLKEVIDQYEVARYDPGYSGRR